MTEDVGDVELQDKNPEQRPLVMPPTSTVLGSDVPEEARGLGFVHGTALLVSVMLGSGLFVSTSDAYRHAGSTGTGMVSWSLAGGLSLLGALCYAELGTVMPRSGGEYAYFLEALGRPFAFTFVWSAFLVLNAAALGVVAVTFSRYMCVLLFDFKASDADLDTTWEVKFGAWVCLIVVCLSNCMGMKESARINTALAVFKLAVVSTLIIIAFNDSGRAPPDDPITTGGSVGDFGLAMVACLWSYDGWNSLNKVTGELQDPNKNLPRCLLTSTGIVVIVSILVNWAYISMVSPHTLATANAIAVEASIAVFGSASAWQYVMVVLVALCALGTAHGTLMACAAVYATAAHDGLWPEVFGQTHHSTRAPFGLWLQTIWSCLLILPGTVSALMQVFGVCIWVFYGTAAVALIILRRRRCGPPPPGSFRVPFGPVIPGLFAISAALIVLNTVITSPINACVSLGLLLCSVPVYYKVYRVTDDA